LGQLVAIDSINPDLVPGSAGEEKIARFIADWFERAGLEVVWEEPIPGRPNVIGIARGTGNGRSLLLNAHMDTVGIAGMQRPHEPFIQDHRLFGRGAYDMKGGLAAIMVTGAAAKNRSLRGDVIVTAVADEEFASIGTASIVKNWRADAAIVTEPTELNICTAHKGFVWLDFETEGIAAHGSRPDLGVDAIVKMGKILVGIEELDHLLRLSPSHRLLGTGSVHASLIQGGQELSSYPNHCFLSVERRTVPGETLQKVEAQMNEILEPIASSDSNFKASVKTRMHREPFETTLDEPIVQMLLNKTRMTLGYEPKEIGHTGWMDSALLSSSGIPTVIFGPGGEGAHAVVEWSNIVQVEQCAQILTAVLEEFCA
ncbi:MAG TPA: M20/M25/M40 family metallo-hydrolase, partial [Ktedonobacteraceae bacterium]|nr:M20/M25/M40 family metallo-hydrolase [Ktedonobacteraceae bacterium]